MSMIPHLCKRTDCEYNHVGTHVCGFFHGDLYFVDCLRNGTMYKKKTQQSVEQPTEKYIKPSVSFGTI
jgi:hypothetical protein